MAKHFITCAYKKCGAIKEVDNAEQQHCSMECWHAAQRDSRTGSDYRSWKRQVIERDNGVCQMCGTVAQSNTAHHMVPLSEVPEARLEVSNGMTLCDICHQVIHGNIGKSNPLQIFGNSREAGK